MKQSGRYGSSGWEKLVRRRKWKERIAVNARKFAIRNWWRVAVIGYEWMRKLKEARPLVICNSQL